MVCIFVKVIEKFTENMYCASLVSESQYVATLPVSDQTHKPSAPGMEGFTVGPSCQTSQTWLYTR